MIPPPVLPNRVTVDLQTQLGRAWVRRFNITHYPAQGAIEIDAIDVNGNLLAGQFIKFHFEDIENVIHGLRLIAAGPLGRLALDADTHTHTDAPDHAPDHVPDHE